MSQQINLLLPELRPRFDWLGLPVVVGAAIAGIVLLTLLIQYQSFRENHLKGQAAAIEGQFLNLQQQAQLLGHTVANRKPNASLPLEIAAARAGVAQRREVLDYVAQGTGESAGIYSGLLQGFANQAGDGVWLVGFSLAPNALEIKGRLLDPAILTRYIDRLNGEPAFAGRRFAALEMKGVDPSALPVAQGKIAPPSRYTEFVLRSEAASVGAKP
ncbi:MAG: hypothetical protein CVU18_04910 [Betaproteobacteria bacterium HGW-Betaproteobacteria-12]|jgi:hypothetical protein|nr:MAG: hypothetical protein CVU18_04910 [Betaproteobacteria bacterium HGW-Betaproteobacteria-12]